MANSELKLGANAKIVFFLGTLALSLVLFKQIKRGLSLSPVLLKQIKRSLALALVLFKQINRSLALSLVFLKQFFLLFITISARILK